MLRGSRFCRRGGIARPEKENAGASVWLQKNDVTDVTVINDPIVPFPGLDVKTNIDNLRRVNRRNVRGEQAGGCRVGGRDFTGPGRILSATSFSSKRGNRMIPVISVVGYADSGKTTVVVDLVGALKNRGYRVAAVKHAPHGYAMDAPGKDSSRYLGAGADKVAVAGPDSLTFHERTPTHLSLAGVCARISGVDCIIAEGFKTEPGPKVGVFRQGYGAGRVEGLIAVVSDYMVEENVPCFSFEQMEELADFIVKYVSGTRVTKE
ncbi:MAG: molybdopterin-guanine dinucleotide biosynthesis protein B [Peptococcaceae bacterium]|nr:molybdopterin-guanine dinucleotide biosynthesis protein B [Peptococcaceae bacterium]